MFIGKKKVLVAMSGGVDSSVVAVLLARMGYEVTGITLQLARSSCGLGACCTGPDLEDVKKMCACEGFEHHTVPAYDDFKEKVINYTASSYAIGLTPSPCVWCNSKVRFNYLYKAMRDLGCEVFVTGHYAHSDGEALLAGVDPNKDQSYFLSMLPKEMMKYVRFPLGNWTKPIVRMIARKLGLIVASKKDSQDLCFVKGHYWDTLNNLNPEIFKPGHIKDITGKVLGDHTGVAQYTIGQRRGIGNLANGSPLYVIDVNAKNNEVTVGNRENMAVRKIKLTSMNMFVDAPYGAFVQAKVRARSALYWARLWGDELEFCSPIYEVARGQICVMYTGRQVVGAGLIHDFTRQGLRFIG